jgi:hypothetical protein
MRHMTNRHIVTMEGGAELHTRKGWRGPSRPSGTNRRRRLTRAGISAAPFSRANRVFQTASAAPKWVWNSIKGVYKGWLAERAEARQREADLQAELAARAAEEAKLLV